jgi:hypothetical protein
MGVAGVSQYAQPTDVKQRQFVYNNSPLRLWCIETCWTYRENKMVKDGGRSGVA